MLVSGTHMVQSALYVQKRGILLDGTKDEPRIYELVMSALVWHLGSDGYEIEGRICVCFYFLSVCQGEKQNIGNLKLLSVFLLPSLLFVS